MTTAAVVTFVSGPTIIASGVTVARAVTFTSSYITALALLSIQCRRVIIAAPQSTGLYAF